MSPGTVCSNLAPFLQIVGYIVTIVKIVIPILLIIFGMLDVGKAVIASKTDEVNKSLKGFAMRCIAAVLVFFLPSIVAVLLDAVANTTGSDVTPTGDANAWRCCWDYVLGGKGTNKYCTTTSTN